MPHITYHTNDRPTVDEYLTFIAQTGLCNQYPRERFCQRIAKLLQNYDVGVIAKNESNEIVGICLGVTDFAYYLLVTDVAVHRDLTHQGIGREMMRRIHELAGGEDDIFVFLDTHPDSKDFYVKCGYEPLTMMCKEATTWTCFDMRNEPKP